MRRFNVFVATRDGQPVTLLLSDDAYDAEGCKVASYLPSRTTDIRFYGGVEIDGPGETMLPDALVDRG